MGHGQGGEFLRGAVLAVCTMAGLSAAPAWAACTDGGGDAGTTCGVPGTAAKAPQMAPPPPPPRPPSPPPPPSVPRPSAPPPPSPPRYVPPPPPVHIPVQAPVRSNGGGDAGNTYGVPGTRGQSAPTPTYTPPAYTPPAPAYTSPSRPSYTPPPSYSPPPSYNRDRPRHDHSDHSDRADRYRDSPQYQTPIYIESPPVQYVDRPVYQTIEVTSDRVEPARSYDAPSAEYQSTRPDVDSRSTSASGNRRGETFYVLVDGVRSAVPPERVRFVDDIPVLRAFGPWYAGYGAVDSDAGARRWLRFTGITMRIFHELTEDQMRKHEQAQIDATTAPFNELIRWKSGVTSGSVRALREFEGPGGNRCRDFEHVVSVGKKTSKTTAMACRDERGDWWLLRPA